MAKSLSNEKILQNSQIFSQFSFQGQRFQNLTKFSPNMETLAKTLKSLSDLCLFSLHVEFRVHCYFYLDGIRKVRKLQEIS